MDSRLLSAANAQEWLQEGKKNDPEFYSATQILEVFESIDFESHGYCVLVAVR